MLRAIKRNSFVVALVVVVVVVFGERNKAEINIVLLTFGSNVLALCDSMNRSSDVLHNCRLY